MENKATIKTTRRGVFEYWLLFTRPFNQLTKQEILVMSAFLYKRFCLLKKIKDEDLLNSLLFSTDVRRDIREELGLDLQIFQNILAKLRKKGVIDGNSIRKSYIPNISEEGNLFRIILEFKLDG